MDVPQKVLDALHAAGDALAATAETDATAASSAAAVVTAQATSDADWNAALGAHQKANELAAEAIAGVKEWLQLPASGGNGSTPATPEAQPQRAAGATSRGSGQK